MVDKVVIPKEVAGAIEYRRGMGDFNSLIVRRILEKTMFHDAETVILRKYFKRDDLRFNELLHALVNGYETEPEYVSFEEAMKALQEGKIVTCYVENMTSGEIDKKTYQVVVDISNLSFSGRQIRIGKWTIEEENQ